MQNSTGAAQQVVVTQNAFVHNLSVAGGENPLTLLDSKWQELLGADRRDD